MSPSRRPPIAPSTEPSPLPPRPVWGAAALRYHRRTGDERFLEMASLTLERMAAGGMHDQVAGGFHRYSTDRRWLVPHFEKMLYDNALLTIAYIEGFQATGREDFARVARDTLRYLERDMSAPEGGFYSATDADSPTPAGHREEGGFFTWTPADLEAALGKTSATAISSYYDVTPAGNFEGRSILNTPRSLQVVAKELGMQAAALEGLVRESREILYEVRAKRPPPLRDDKILTAWNGLAIGAFARAAIAFGEPRYAERAIRAAAFVLERLRVDGRLRRSFIDGQVREAAVLDDYAAMISGLLDLYEATGETRWVREAIALDAVLERDFEDREGGGFFQTSHDHEQLLAREKPSYDGAEPSGNSVHALNLLRLAEMTGMTPTGCAPTPPSRRSEARSSDLRRRWPTRCSPWTSGSTRPRRSSSSPRHREPRQSPFSSGCGEPSSPTECWVLRSRARTSRRSRSSCRCSRARSRGTGARRPTSASVGSASSRRWSRMCSPDRSGSSIP